MQRKLFLFRIALAVCLALCLAAPAFADGTDEAYTGTFEEFAQLEGLQGVFVSDLPAAEQALVCLGSRVIRRGDVLTANELQYLTFAPVNGWAGEAEICFLPVCGGTLGDEAVLTMHVERERAPAAPDQELEVFRGVPGSGRLHASGTGSLTFRLLDGPEKGTVELDADGAFTYTPKGKLVGEDRFTFTVTDGAGRTSEPAAVRITIRKPLDARTFADLDRDRQFTALWLRQTGVYTDQEEDGRLCFYPERSVSRMDFLAGLMDVTGIAPEPGLPRTGFADESDVSAARLPYLAAAQRRGLARGYDSDEGPIFLPNQPIRTSEAVQMIARALDSLGAQTLSGAGQSDEAAADPDETAVPVWAGADGDGAEIPVWAGAASAVLRAAGFDCSAPDASLTRSQAADLLYQAARLVRSSDGQTR